VQACSRIAAEDLPGAVGQAAPGRSGRSTRDGVRPGRGAAGLGRTP